MDSYRLQGSQLQVQRDGMPRHICLPAAFCTPSDAILVVTRSGGLQGVLAASNSRLPASYFSGTQVQHRWRLLCRCAEPAKALSTAAIAIREMWGRQQALKVALWRAGAKIGGDAAAEGLPLPQLYSVSRDGAVLGFSYAADDASVDGRSTFTGIVHRERA